jgi:hypothetical protein
LIAAQSLPAKKVKTVKEQLRHEDHCGSYMATAKEATEEEMRLPMYSLLRMTITQYIRADLIRQVF